MVGVALKKKDEAGNGNGGDDDDVEAAEGGMWYGVAVGSGRVVVMGGDRTSWEWGMCVVVADRVQTN